MLCVRVCERVCVCVCVCADDVAHLTYLLKCGEAEDVRRSHADAWQYGRVLFRARTYSPRTAIARWGL